MNDQLFNSGKILLDITALLAFPINDLCGSQALRSMKTNVKVKVSIEQVSGTANGPTVISSKYLKTMLIISDQL